MQLLSGSPLSGRRGHSSFVVGSSGELLVVGGDGLSDVWRSLDGGSSWSVLSESGGWSVRRGSSVVRLSNGSLMLLGGESLL